ncbi:major facilitator superfamily domain-containing protein [Aspergillus filifer]
MSTVVKTQGDSAVDENKVTTHHHEGLGALDEKPAPRTRGDYSGAQAKTDPVEIRLVRKLDMWIMPTLWLIFWLNYLDRNAIALARLYNLEEDLHLSSSEYQTCVSILFVGYILGQIPSNMILTRVRPSWYMAGFMALWAAVSALTALAKDFEGLLLTRFFLGITEAPFYAGALYLLSIFYNRKEIATRISILYTGNILATAFAGLIAAGVFHGMDNLAGVKGWQWLFILQGTVTFVVAVLSVFTLPDDPRNTRWLSPEERHLAYERIEAASDPRLWLFAFMQHMHLAANGFKNFFPTAVETLGFSTTITLVLTCPPYLIAGAFSVYWSWNSGRMNERTWHITVAKCIAIFGFILGCATLNTGARYFSMIVFAIGTYAVNSIILGWVSSTCGQTNEKKASSLAIVNTIANISFIWTPYLWPSSDEPRYAIAMSASAAVSLACLAGAWVMKIWLVQLNKRIRQSSGESHLFYAY